MRKKLMMMVVTAALGVATVAFADPVVTDITAKQRAVSVERTCGHQVYGVED